MQVILDGDLTMDELKTLFQCIRDIEQRDRERVIRIDVDAPNASMPEILAVIDSIQPPLAIRNIYPRARTGD